MTQNGHNPYAGPRPGQADEQTVLRAPGPQRPGHATPQAPVPGQPMGWGQPPQQAVPHGQPAGQPMQQQPMGHPQPQQLGHPQQQVTQPQPGVQPQQGPPPGSVAWLQQHYPAPGEQRPAPQQAGQPGQQAPAYTGSSRFAPGGPRDPNGPQDPPKKASGPSRARTIAVAGVAAVLVAAVVVAAVILGKPKPDPPGEPSRPSDGAVRFMEAVAAGDANRALAAQVAVPKDTTLLTDQVLLESRKTAPISKIRVSQETSTDVELTYNLGEAEVRARFKPARQPDGTYKVERGTTTVQVTRPKQVPVQVNGVRLTTNEVEALPGSYALTTGMNNIGFADSSFTVSGPESFPRLAPAPTLTEQGRKAFVAASRDSLTKCLQAKDINPPNCPQKVELRPGQKPVNSTVKWSLVDDPFAGAEPKLSLNDDTSAEMKVTVRTTLSADVMQDNKPGTVNNQELRFEATATGSVAGDPITVRYLH